MYIIVQQLQLPIKLPVKSGTVANLRVFRCIAYAHEPDAIRQNLGKKTEKWGLLATAESQKAMNETTGRVVLWRDAIFNKPDFRKPDTARSEDTVVIKTISQKSDEVGQPELGWPEVYANVLYDR